MFGKYKIGSKKKRESYDNIEKGNFNNKENISIKKRKFRRLVVHIFVLVICSQSIVFAENIERKNNMQSKGKIEYEQGKVRIDSADLRYLADEIDSLETVCKSTTIDALNAIGTYFRNDGNKYQ